MKKIDFPLPVHEQAVEILEKTKKEIEALGFGVNITTSLHCDDLNSSPVMSLPPEKRGVQAFFNICFTAGIEI
jgi:hypothetical protein